MSTNDCDEHGLPTPGRATEWESARRVLAQQGPPERVEQALLLAFNRRPAPPPWYRRLSAQALASALSLAAVGGIAAFTVAAIFRYSAHAPLPPATTFAYSMDHGFYPLVDIQHMKIPSHVELVHAELPRHALASLGIALDENLAEELVRTDLVVTDAGEPIAIRVAFN